MNGRAANHMARVQGGVGTLVCVREREEREKKRRARERERNRVKGKKRDQRREEHATAD